MACRKARTGPVHDGVVDRLSDHHRPHRHRARGQALGGRGEIGRDAEILAGVVAVAEGEAFVFVVNQGNWGTD